MKFKIVTKGLLLIFLILWGFATLLIKTNLAFGGNYFSGKNIKIAAIILVVILVILTGAGIFDLIKNNKKKE